LKTFDFKYILNLEKSFKIWNITLPFGILYSSSYKGAFLKESKKRKEKQDGRRKKNWRKIQKIKRR
jgi:hypothetical protein